MEQIKHECGVAMIRLLKPIEHYRRKYGTSLYGLNKLYLLMEKQHNRGQEGAGAGVVKIDAAPGEEYLFRERAIGAGAIQDIFSRIYHQIEHGDWKSRAGLATDRNDMERAEGLAPFLGQIYMGHLRYSTTGRSGIQYVHPFLRRNNWRSRNLMVCGNFNMTNVDEIFRQVVAKGQHPRLYSDTIMLLEQLGYALDRENHRLYRGYRDSMGEADIERAIEDNMDLGNVLGEAATSWDGGFVICGATGSGDMFCLRDSLGIRPAFYYHDDEVAVVASERPVIQTVFNVKCHQVNELRPGSALIATKGGEVSVRDVLSCRGNARCSFERIYFSRGSDSDIYRERKALGANLVDEIVRHVDGDLDHTVFSFIPNTAEVAFIGMVQGLEKVLDQRKMDAIQQALHDGAMTRGVLHGIMQKKIRVEKIAIKDIKLRTFIAEGNSRNELAAHVYDVTWGCVDNGTDNLVVIDDSIVRGTTLRQSILSMLDRLRPRKIIVVSSSPQVRYPDCYGIDMSRMSEFIAFRAAVELLRESGKGHVLDEVYHECQNQLSHPADMQTNCVKAIYAPFTDQEVSRKIAQMLTGPDISAKVEIIYQTLDGLHKAVPDHPGDWYFSGNYPTAGGVRLVNQAFVNFYEGNPEKR